MASSKQGRQRTPRRRFEPSLDGRLESRVVLSGGHVKGTAYHYLLTHPNPINAFRLHVPRFLASDAPFYYNAGFRRKFFVGVQVAHGGQAVEVTALDGSHYMIKLSYTSNTLQTNIAEGANGNNGAATSADVNSLVAMQNANYPQPIGTIRAYPMPGGKVGLIIDGSTQNTELTVNPLGEPQLKGYAHSFAYSEAQRKHFLNIGQITVNSGQIGSILGFQDAILSGPLVANASTAIDRIAFYALAPGASIQVGGDVNTLDIFSNADLSGAGTGISIGRDLNLLNVGGNLTLNDGATFSIGRDLGLVSQPPKGTGTGSNVLLLNFNTLLGATVNNVALPPSVGAFIQGNVFLTNGGSFSIGRQIDNPMYIEGGIVGFSHLLVNTATTPTSPPLLIRLPNNASSATGTVVSLGGASG